MTTILDFLRQESAVWRTNENFHNEHLDSIVGEFLVNNARFEEAKALLQQHPSVWVANDHPLLNYGSIAPLIRQYIIDHDLATSFVTEEELKKDPSLLGKYQINLKQYPNLMKDPVFQQEYLKKGLNGSLVLSQDVIKIIPFDLCYKMISRVCNTTFNSIELKGMQSVMDVQLTKGPKHLRENVIPLFSGKTSCYMKQMVKKVFEKHPTVAKVMLENLPFCRLFYSKDELANIIIDKYTYKISSDTINALFNQFKERLWRLDLRKMKNFNEEGALRLFISGIKTKPPLEVTYKEALRTKRTTIEYRASNNTMGLFTSHELSMSVQCYVYFQARERGLDYLGWVLPQYENYVVDKRRGDFFTIVPIVDLQKEYDDLKARLTECLGLDIDTWLDTQKEIGSSILDCSKRTDYEKVIMQEFDALLEQRTGIAASPLVEFDLLF